MTGSPNGQTKLRVFRKLPAPVEARIRRDYKAMLNEDDIIFEPRKLAYAAQDCDGLLVTSTERFGADLVASLPETVRIIATYSVGYDHIDVAAATERGIVVTNTPDVLTDATADVTLLLLLGAARGAGWGEAMVRGKTWGTWAPTHPLGFEVTGKRLGILGMGRIGRAVAHRARAFGLKIHYHNRTRLASPQECGAVFHPTLQSLLAVSDFFSINCASTPETRGILDAEAIAQLPDGAIVVNTARGDIVVDDALIDALRGGKLAAAGLDVFRNEPDIDPRYRELENTFLLPHLGSATIETRTAMGMRALDNLDAFFRGETPGDLVRP